MHQDHIKKEERMSSIMEEPYQSTRRFPFVWGGLLVLATIAISVALIKLLIK